MKIGDSYGHSLQDLPFESFQQDIYVGYEPPKDVTTKLWFNPHANIGFSDFKANTIENLLNYYFSAAAINYKQYNSLEDAVAGTNAIDNGKILTYMYDNILNIVLLDNITATTVININKNCNIFLNGKIITLQNGAELYVENAPKVTIDGSIAGSEITKTAENETLGRLIYVSNSNCFVHGGLYTTYGSYVNAAPFHIYDDGILTVENAKFNNYVSASTALYGINNRGNLFMNNCQMINENIIGQAAGISCTATALQTTLKNSTINVRAAAGPLTIGIAVVSPDITVERCKISVTCIADNTNVHGIYAIVPSSNPAQLNITQCHITADGSTNGTDSQGNHIDKSAAAITTSAAASLKLRGGYYWGAREGLSLRGPTEIDGGIFEGCGHGGMYCAGESFKVKNAILRNVPYTGESDWTGENSGNNDNYHAGVVYCGSSDENKNLEIYFNNCRFEAPTAANNMLIAKYHSTKVYLSNIRMAGNTGSQLRSDSTCTIYVGKNVISEVPYQNGQCTTTTVNGGVIDFDTYKDYSFITETAMEDDNDIPSSSLAMKNESGKWVPIYKDTTNDLTESKIIKLIKQYIPADGDEVNY